MKADTIHAIIGNTPHICVNRLFGSGRNVWIKSERANPGGSIKDRIGLSMVEDAARKRDDGGNRKSATTADRKSWFVDAAAI